MAKVTFAGNPMPLKGDLPMVGQTAPDFTAQKNDLSPFKLSETAGKVRLISVVPSLDTGVCSLQTRHFNEDAVELGPMLWLLRSAWICLLRKSVFVLPKGSIG